MKLRNQLIILNLMSLVLILIIVFFPTNFLRILLGIPFLLFIPGYTLLAALFPRRGELTGISRPTLSFALSIAIVPLLGLVLNYTPWGIRLEPILYTITLFIFITSIIAWFRQRNIIDTDRYVIRFRFQWLGWDQGTRSKLLTVTLIIVVLGLLGMIGYFISQPKSEEAFTEFYILGQEGETANYPRELTVGEPGVITVGINNHEGSKVNYRIEVIIDGKKNNEVGPIILSNEQKWEGEVRFISDTSGENKRVDFFLYKNGEVEPSLGPLYIWINVRQ
jgi:uncharacterized membrane protein